MTFENLRAFVSAYRWPIGIVGILSMSIVAQGTMVYFATRKDAPRPLPDYYEKAKAWEADHAAVEASRQLGWKVTVDVPDVPVEPGQPRPVDLTVADRDGAPVAGLAGDLVAVRPADARVNTTGRLVELPQAPGHYRTLVALPAAGLWEMNLDTRRGEQRFVHAARITWT